MRLFPSPFGFVRLFRKFFPVSKGPILQFFDILQLTGFSKSPKRHSFHNFWHCETFQNDYFLSYNLVFSVDQHAISEIRFLRPFFSAMRLFSNIFFYRRPSTFPRNGHGELLRAFGTMRHFPDEKIQIPFQKNGKNVSESYRA